MDYQIVEGVNLPLLECFNAIRGQWILRWSTLEEGKWGEVILPYKPTLEQIKEIVLTYHNQEIDRQITSGYRWGEHLVWLNEENQNNYFRAFTLACLTDGETLPQAFKLGTDENPHLEIFSDIETLRAFTLGASKHVSDTLTKGWQRKMNINWTEYEEADT